MAIHFDVSNTVLLDFDVMSNSASSYASVVNLQTGEEKEMMSNDHNEDQWMYIIEGEGEIKIGEGSYLLFSRRVLFIEAGEEYKIINTGNKPLRAIKIFANRTTLPEVVEAF